MEISSIANKTVLIRVGFDIPNLHSLDRIKFSFKTLFLLLLNNNKLILISKWGRPNGYNPDFSLSKIFEIFSREFNNYLLSNLSLENSVQRESLLDNLSINFLDQFQIGFGEIQTIINKLPQNNITILENIYFDKRECSFKKDERLEIATLYSGLADVFIDECFISSHREDATNTEIKQLLPHTLGLNYQLEIKNLNYFLNQPERPFILVLGGAKLATKLPLLESLLPKVDRVMLGGTICFPFLNVMGKIETDCSKEELDLAFSIIEKYNDKLVLATDFVPSLKDAKDIGPNSLNRFKEHLSTAKSVFWNGPLGQYEQLEFAKGTLEIAEFISNLGVHAVLGGGDSVAAIPENILNKFTFVSSGGGATLEFLSKG
jgi:phosphoglycerate kinase